MQDKKYFLKTRRLVPISFLVVSIILALIWLWIRNLERTELAIVANIFLPILIVFGIIGAVLQLTLISKLYYVKLTSNSIVIYRVFPASPAEYTAIKKIAFDSPWFKGIDTGSYISWPVAMRMKNPEEFISDLRARYKNATGKILKIEKNY